MIDALFNWFDERLGISGSGRKMLNKIFPDHWSFLIGEIALYSFIVLLGTGVFLTLYFVPSSKDVIYEGSYAPLRGQPVSEAFASTLNLSFAVRGGLLMRQMHHWAANIFVGSIVVHMLRIFFTGAFRKPRELNWIVGSTLLILAIFNGFLGYSLPDDLVSGTGIRISFSIVESIPLIGSYAAFFLFGGNFPGNAIIPRFFILHVLILPAVIVGLLSAHLGMLVRQKHTQFPGHAATRPATSWVPHCGPHSLAKTTGFMCLTVAVTGVLSAFFQINPVWLYGPYVPYKVSYAVQPDWYMGWLDGRASYHAELGDRGLWRHDPERLLPGDPSARHHFRRPAGVAVHRGQESPTTHAGAPDPWTVLGTGRNARRSVRRCSRSTSCCSGQVPPTSLRTTCRSL